MTTSTSMHTLLAVSGRGSVASAGAWPPPRGPDAAPPRRREGRRHATDRNRHPVTRRNEVRGGHDAHARREVGGAAPRPGLRLQGFGGGGRRVTRDHPRAPEAHLPEARDAGRERAHLEHPGPVAEDAPGAPRPARRGALLAARADRASGL